MSAKELPPVLYGKNTIVCCPPPEKFDEVTAKVLSDHEGAMKHLHAMSKHDVGGWTIEDAKNRRIRLEGLFKDKTGWFCTMEHKDTHEFIGLCGLRDIDWFNRSGEMGIIIAADYWGKGYCGEAHFIIFKHAFEVLGLERIIFVTASTNEGMIGFCRNVLHACHEGTGRNRFSRSWTDPSQGYENTEHFSVLSHEWPDIKTRLEQKYNLI